MTPSTPSPPEHRIRGVARWLLAAFLVVAGAAHLVMPEAYLAQVPTWLPARRLVILISGIAEIALGLALVLLRRHRVVVGWAVAGFLTVIFVGNVDQAVTGTAGFGLDTTAARWLRLLVQPVFIAWALWSTGAWAHLRRSRRRRDGPEH